jgi:hypothetical protein
MARPPIARTLLAWLVAGGAALAAEPATPGSYTFDVESFERSPLEVGGYVEAELRHFEYDRDSALFGIARHPELDKERNQQFLGTLHLEGTYRAGIATARASGEATGTWDHFGTVRDATLFEGLLAVQPDPGITLEAGKKALKWGKGYAWNPVGFVERSKDPDDPAESREGFVMLTADLIASFDGPLRTAALTPVVIPVDDPVNADFASEDGFFYAAKLYFLAWDTDIDLMFLAGDGKTTRYGFDISRNITSNLEVHGEWAFIDDNRRTITGVGQANRKVAADGRNWLVGLRYLSETDTTVIAEYYRQGTGFSRSEMRSFHELAHEAVEGGSSTLLSRARAARESGYGRPTPGRNYLYLRVSQKEPLNLLYWTPAATSIVNLDDGSFSLTPEIQYTGIDDLELRFRVGYLHGGRDDEFGEKQNDLKAEFRLRYHF